MTAVDTITHEAEWHEWRRGGIGGSDVAGLLGLSRYSSPWSIWASKVGLLEPTESTARQRIGHRMESVLKAEFEDAQPGRYVVGEQTWCEHETHSWARCTVDGFVAAKKVTGDMMDPLGVFEAKTDGRFGWPDGLPPQYRAQAIWNMGVTAMRSAFVAVMFAGFRFEVFELGWDDAAEADWQLMFHTAETFWTEHVVSGVPPAVDGSDATADALAAVYPEHQPGVEVDLDGLGDLLVERGDLKDRESTTKARLKEIDNTIRERFGDAEIGTFDGVPVFSYRSSERAGYTVEPTTVRTLRAIKPKKGD